MRLEVRVFGGLREVLGGSRITVELPEGASVAQLRAAVVGSHPSLAPLLPVVNVAVDLEVAADDTELTGANEVALLPPVAGGAGPTHLPGRPPGGGRCPGGPRRWS